VAGGKSGVSTKGLAEHAQINFGGWLTAQLKRKGWNRNEFTEAAGVPTGVVYRWCENTNRPSPKNCPRIAAALGVDIDAVLAAAGHRPANAFAAGVIHATLVNLITGIPEPLLVPFVPMFRALAHPANQEESMTQLTMRLNEDRQRMTALDHPVTDDG
jgi:transcriptional regulator with XRE-family HTH domain